MVRPARIEFPGALYHVTARGDRREVIYDDDRDRKHFPEVLAEVIGQFNWRCHAYCLMDNHYHLMIATPDGNLAKGMRQLNGVFTQSSNRRHNRSGHVFQGRYKAILVDEDSYLLELSRYAQSGARAYGALAGGMAVEQLSRYGGQGCGTGVVGARYAAGGICEAPWSGDRRLCAVCPRRAWRRVGLEPSQPAGVPW